MKKILLLTALLLSLAAHTFAQSADAITGKWLNAEQDGKVDIYKTGDKYAGKIVWTKFEFEKDGKTLRKDAKNEDAGLRSRPIMGMLVLSNFTYNNGIWSGGEAYDPRSGKTYSSRIKLKGNSLEIRGYIGKPILGKTTVWTRTQ